MVKKIIFVLVSVAIVAAGYMGFAKLSYFERSARIFRMDNQSFSGRTARGFEEGGHFRSRGEGRPDFRQLPDSLRRGPGHDERFQIERRIRGGEFSDSIRRRAADLRINEHGNFPDGSNRGPRTSESGIHRGEGQRGDLRVREKVSLQNVGWFLAVFASFTVITFCIDRLYRLFRMRKL